MRHAQVARAQIDLCVLRLSRLSNWHWMKNASAIIATNYRKSTNVTFRTFRSLGDTVDSETTFTNLSVKSMFSLSLIWILSVSSWRKKDSIITMSQRATNDNDWNNRKRPAQNISSHEREKCAFYYAIVHVSRDWKTVTVMCIHHNATVLSIIRLLQHRGSEMHSHAPQLMQRYTLPYFDRCAVVP